MTVPAHNANKPIGGASRSSSVASGNASRAQMLRELHPELYKDIPRMKLPKAPKKKRPPIAERIEPPPPLPPPPPDPSIHKGMIYAYLHNNPPATTAQIAKATGISYNTVRARLSDGIPTIAVVGTCHPEKGKRIAMWGVVEK